MLDNRPHADADAPNIRASPAAHGRCLRHRHGPVLGARASSPPSMAWTAGSGRPNSPFTARSGPAWCFCRCLPGAASLAISAASAGVAASLLTVFGGAPFAMLSATGFILVPLGHGGVIQPSCAALGGIALSALVLGEPMPRRGSPARWHRRRADAARLGGARHHRLAWHHRRLHLRRRGLQLCGVRDDAAAVAHRAAAAAMVVSVLSLAYVPVHWAVFGFARMQAAGWSENLLQIVAQGALRRRRRDLSVHPHGGAARRQPRGAVSGAGAGHHPADRLPGARRSCRAWSRSSASSSVGIGFRSRWRCVGCRRLAPGIRLAVGGHFTGS